MLLKRLFFYILIFLVILYLVFISAWINLSSKSLTPWFESKLNSYLPRKYLAEIGSVETQFSGLEVKNLKIRDLTEDMAILDIQSVSVSISLIQILLFQEIDYNLELYGGNIEGELDFFPGKSVEFEISELQFNRNALIRKTNLINSNPIINGSGEYTFGEKPEGKLDLDIESITISGKPEYTNIPLELPDAAFTRLNSELSLNGNDANLRINCEGDLSGKMEGTIKVNHAILIKSDFDLDLTGSLTPEFESKLGFLKGILVNYKNADGQISVKLSGNIQRPRVKKI